MASPATVILGLTVTTLWYFKASAPIENEIHGKRKKSRIGGGADSEECEFSLAYQDH